MSQRLHTRNDAGNEAGAELKRAASRGNIP
jgi:hypothetical protein